MQIETPPTETPKKPPKAERRGIVIVNTGDGKGKSTAAFGLALRAHGRGKAVKIFQFMKVPSARFGEHRMFEQTGFPIEGLGDGLAGRVKIWSIRPNWRVTAGKRPGLPFWVATIFMVTLDEITYPLIYGWLPLDDVLETLKTRPSMCTWC
jgi:cob(I)alamin adenosyltransferase